jgi:hypothetical protein
MTQASGILLGNCRTLTDDAVDAFFAILTNGR